MTKKHGIVVGAGIAGLLAATQLQNAGWRTTVLDKSRGVGGRMATRRFDGAIFDHGAQFFTVRDAEFARWVDAWQAAGVVELWTDAFAKPGKQLERGGHRRYRGVPGMTGIAKHLAASLEVHLSEKVQSITNSDDQWRVVTEAGKQIAGDALILTPPVPQSLALLQALNIPTAVHEALQNIRYDPCLAVMAIVEEPSAIPAPGALQIGGEPIHWIADNTQKGVSPDVRALTIHAGPVFSRDHFDDDPDRVAQMLFSAAAEWLPKGVISYQVHRWRYSIPKHPYPARMLLVKNPLPLLFAGDAFGGPRVEGAALSGLAAAQALLASNA